MKAKPTTNPPCKMAKGEIRRIPEDINSHLVGYHIGCPQCGFVSISLPSSEFSIVEQNRMVTFSQPHRCPFCRILIHLQSNEMALEADEETQYVQYRPM